jgi:hypothetical protein
MDNSRALVILIAMKSIWPHGPGPRLYKTELHLNRSIETVLADDDVMQQVLASLDAKDAEKLNPTTPKKEL